MDCIPLGLDIETSTGNPAYGEILSIGAYDPSRKGKKYFYKEIRHKKLVVEPKAFEVNKIDITGLYKLALTNLSTCDTLLSNWIGNRDYMPVGFNVGTFDMKFIERTMPKSSNSLGYRSMDLNALCLFIAYKTGKPYYAIKAKMKKVAIEQAREVTFKKLPGNAKYDEHHGLFDAVVAVNCLNYLTNNY